MTAHKYGINEKKKANVSALTDSVEKLQFHLAQQQSVVDSLTQKSLEFSSSLAMAERKRELASSQSDLAIEVVSCIKTIKRKSNLVKKQTDKSDAKINKTVSQMTQLVRQVIFAVEIVNKLVALIQKKKSSGAIISAELSSVMANAATDANTAVATTLVALRSCHVAMATGEECSQLTEQGVHQGIDLYAFITGETKILTRYKKMCEAVKRVEALEQGIEENLPHIQQGEQSTGEGAPAAMDVAELVDEEDARNQLIAELDADIASFDTNPTEESHSSLLSLITHANHTAKHNYNLALSANNRVTRELEEAKSKLAKTSVNLASLEAGLSAANAAAAIA